MQLGLMGGVLVGCVGLIGCGPDFRTLCEGEIACTGGNDADIEVCVAVSEVRADRYDDIGCGAEYDAYAACVEPHWSCKQEMDEFSCFDDFECQPNGRCSKGVCLIYGVDVEGQKQCVSETAAFNRCN